MMIRLLAFLLLVLSAQGVAASPVRFSVTVASALVGDEPPTGRLLVVLTRDAAREPRLQMTRNGPAVIGMDVPKLEADQPVVLDGRATASPAIEGLAAGTYYAQAVFVPYERMKRQDGHVVWVPNASERRPLMQLPGNLYSMPVRVDLDPAAGGVVTLELSRKVEASLSPVDTEWIKHIRIESRLLSEFWGKPMYLGATVVVPRGWNDKPEKRYPILYHMSPGQDASRPYQFNPDPVTGSRSFGPEVNIQTGHDFYKSWISDGFPSILLATIIQPTPYFLEGYAVDSANNGPVGQAIVEELMPAIEERFRALGTPETRIVQGLSTGGWEALALQVKYPDFFGGVWTYNPDPVDFRRFIASDIYADSNAFSVPYNDWYALERPFQRSIEGQTVQTMRELSLREAALGSRGRSGSQLDAWNAAFGPVGPDGYPGELWDKKTGRIDPEVAAYMRAGGYDLTDYIRRNWAVLGPKLAGKIHLISADMDEYHLNLPVNGFIDMIREKGGESYPIRIVYGRRKGHDWHHVDYAEMIREVAEHVGGKQTDRTLVEIY